MKVLSVFLLVLLVGTVISGIPVKSYADPQLDTLLNIATQARNSLGITISQINNVPDQINQLYKQGSNETDELAQAVTQQDIDSAKQHFLAAMKYFKETNDQINSLNATAPNDQQKTEMIHLRGEIVRLENMGKLLKSIALQNDVDINFTGFDGMLQNATQDLGSENLDDASAQIQNANDFVVTTHSSLTKAAQERIAEKEKEFTEKQIAQLNIVQANKVNTTSQSNAAFNATSKSNVTRSTLPVNSSYVAPTVNNSNITMEHNPKDMVAELKRLVAEGKVDQAINLIKTIQAYQKAQSTEKATAISSTTNTTATVPTPPSLPPAPPVNTTATVPTPPSLPPAPPVNTTATVPTPPSLPPAPPVNTTATPENTTVPTPPTPPENTTMSTSQFTTQENHTVSDQNMGHNEHLKKHDEHKEQEKRHHHQN